MEVLHPLIVHFPIALLTLYSIIECLRFGLFKKEYWFNVKGVLVIIGTIGAFFSLASGEALEGLFRNDATLRPVLGMHSAFASATTWVYAIIALAYLFMWVKKEFGYETKITNYYSEFVLKNYVVISLAILGFILLSITGALGGALVHGVDSDVFVNFVYKLLF